MPTPARGQPHLDDLLRELRAAFPNAAIHAEHVRLDGDPIVFRATIELPGAGRVTRYGTAPANAPDAIRAAETDALLNALGTVGFGSSTSEPRETRPSAPRTPRQTPTPEPTTSASSESVDADLLDTSWTKFWEWAHTLGLRSKKEIEARLGEPVDTLTPGQIRERLIARNG